MDSLTSCFAGQSHRLYIARFFKLFFYALSACEIPSKKMAGKPIQLSPIQHSKGNPKNYQGRCIAASRLAGDSGFHRTSTISRIISTSSRTGYRGGCSGHPRLVVCSSSRYWIPGRDYKARQPISNLAPPRVDETESPSCIRWQQEKRLNDKVTLGILVSSGRVVV